MLVELLGLPGSGKSTLVKTLLQTSSDHSTGIETLNQRVEHVLKHHKTKRGYLRRKQGRGWFFATFEFAHYYPEIFRIVFENAVLHQDRNLDFLISRPNIIFLNKPRMPWVLQSLMKDFCTEAQRFFCIRMPIRISIPI